MACICACRKSSGRSRNALSAHPASCFLSPRASQRQPMSRRFSRADARVSTTAWTSHERPQRLEELRR